MEKFTVKKNTRNIKNDNNKKLLPKKRKITNIISRVNENDENIAERVRGGFDRPFFVLVLILLCIGTIFVFSASYVYAKNKYDDSFFFAKKQLFWALISIAVLYAFSVFDYLILKNWSYRIFIISYVLLWFVFFFGSDANGAKRWIYVGPLSFQPSEIVKLAVVLAMSKYVVSLTQRNTDGMRTIKYGIIPFALTVILLAVPLYFQPHLSAMVLIFGTMFIFMCVSGCRMDIMSGAAVLGAGALTMIVLFTSHGRTRLHTFFHPEEDILGDGWQPLQSIYAIGSGGLWGTGIGQSKQKHLYLPEPQNDYIFSIICEEMGFVFAVAIIILFLLLIWRGFVIAQNAPSKYSSLVVMGIIIEIGLQVFLNIAVVSNLIPSTGISLPFFSYGGTSLTIFMAEMGIILGISRYSYKDKN